MNDTLNFSDTFLQEAEDLLVVIEDRILDLESDPSDKEAIDGLFRAIHTIKGSGSMFGFDTIADFTHHIETALDLVRSGDLSISRELIDLTLSSKDQIKLMLNELQGGEPSDPRTIARIVDALKQMTSQDTLMEDDATQQAVEVKSPDSNKPSLYRIRFSPDPSMFVHGMDPFLLVKELDELGALSTTALTDNIPPLDTLNPEQCYLSFSGILETSHPIDTIKDVFIFVEDTSSVDIVKIDIEEEDDIPKIGDILVERGDTSRKSISSALSEQTRIGEILLKKGEVTKGQMESALFEQKMIRQRKESKQKESIRVPADKLDRLINLVGELVITQAQLQSAASSIDDMHFSTPVEEIGRLTTELRDIALNVRMMPIGSTFNRFRRLVRDLSSDLGKQIRLETFGAETEMDKTVIERMGDLLVHMIRNSIDHGIETPEIRKKAGKNEQGTIRLSAKHEGDKVVISIEDDGKGIPVENIRQKAIEKGLITENQTLSRQEILQLIMAPGFSTAEEVSNISGRGVGMDVVKKEIAALRGTFEINSEEGKGTQMRLSLPLTLAIIDGLLVSVGDLKYIIPVAVIAECLEIAKDTLAQDRRRNLLSLRGDFIPFVRLRDVFKIDSPAPKIEEAVIVEIGESLFGIIVDSIIGDHQTVIKALGKLYRNVVGVSGATILGDGSVAMIIDISSILQIAELKEKNHLKWQMAQSIQGATLLH